MKKLFFVLILGGFIAGLFHVSPWVTGGVSAVAAIVVMKLNEPVRP